MAPVSEGTNKGVERIDYNYTNGHSYTKRSSSIPKKPRHTPASRKEATRRERIRVQELRLAYRSLQTVLNIPTRGRPRYLYILQSAISYIRFLESKIGLSHENEVTEYEGDIQNKNNSFCWHTSQQQYFENEFNNLIPNDGGIPSPTDEFEFIQAMDFRNYQDQNILHRMVSNACSVYQNL